MTGAARIRRLIATVTALGLAVAGCTSGPDGAIPTADHAAPTADRGASSPSAPVTEDATAPRLTPAATLPVTWATSVVVDTGWETEPQERSGIFVGFAVRGDGSARHLEYSAIDNRGTVLWRATRPAACTGFAVSMAGERSIVVLTDARIDGDSGDGGDGVAAEDKAGDGVGDGDAAGWQTTATAYDLRSGTRLWGPVDVAGTVQGPGLVFGRSAPGGTMGAVGPRQALDPRTGKVVFDEAAQPDGEQRRLIGEYDGTVLLADGGTLKALDASTGESLWGRSIADGANRADDELRAASSSEVGEIAGLAVLSGGADSAVRIVELASGDVLAEGVDGIALEPLTNTVVWSSNGVIRGFAANAVLGVDAGIEAGKEPTREPWERDIESARVAAAGAGLVYLRVGKAVQVINAVTGRDAQAYDAGTDAPFAVPRHISSGGSALFVLGGRYLLGTVVDGEVGP